MTNVADYIERGARRSGFRRSSFVERNIPTVPSNVVVLPFYGDIRSTFILSSFILKEYKRLNPNKYLILCTWPGFRSFFTYVDEFWTMDDTSVLKGLALGANNFYNSSDLGSQVCKNLLESFDIITYSDLKKYFNDGFGPAYWSEVGEPRRFLPQIQSASMIGPQFKQEMERKTGRKVVVYPTTKVRSWQKGKSEYIQVGKAFWTHLGERLLENNVVPVFYQNQFTYDMSRDFADRCIYLVPDDVSELLAAMSYVGCALDVFNGFSRLALAARTPFVCVDERSRYLGQRDSEIDDLCEEIHKQYIFAFSTMLLSGGPKDWDNSFVENILVRLRSFLPFCEDNKVSLPLNESYDSIPYGKVRDRKSKRMGVTFVRSKYQ